MKKHIMLLLAILFPALFYLMGSFIAMSFDPRDWEVIGRYFYAMFSAIALIFCVGWWYIGIASATKMK